jgi:predicted DNA repair protein MutK
VLLLPALLALDAFLPQAITPLLMLGGLYLCFEGAEKLVHAFAPHADETIAEAHDTKDPTRLEEEKVAGAIKTDFILSAEIMTIALSVIESDGFILRAVTLAVVGIAITVAVYGVVAVIVKMDDIGLHLAARARLAATRALGRGLVKGMPVLLKLLSTIGTAAMLWVGGNIVVHGLDVLGWHAPYAMIHHWAVAVAEAGPASLAGLVEWAVTAACDGVIGLALGLLLIPVVTRVILPLWGALRGTKTAAH